MNPALTIHETAFEKRRGVSRVELLSTFAQVHIGGLPEPVHTNRLRALQLLKEEGVGLFFLKLTPSGLSFLVAEQNVSKLEHRFKSEFESYSIRGGKSVVFVNAVNMRDEEGLLPSIISEAIASGAKIEHLGDMHDSVCIAASHEDAQRIAAAIEAKEFVTL